MRSAKQLISATCLIVLLIGCGSSGSQSSSGYSSGPTYGSSTSGRYSSHRRSHRSRRYRSSGYSSGSRSTYYSSSSSRRKQPPSTLLGPRSKTSGCHVQGPLPDRACTPGAIFAGVTKDQICVLGYSRRVRFVPYSTKRTAYQEYGITSHAPGQYEVDHLVSLELGGSNSIANLWPEAAQPHPGFHEKDQVENYIHDQVCSGRLSLQKAQREIASNWLTVYRSISH